MISAAFICQQSYWQIDIKQGVRSNAHPTLQRSLLVGEDDQELVLLNHCAGCREFSECGNCWSVRETGCES